MRLGKILQPVLLPMGNCSPNLLKGTSSESLDLGRCELFAGPGVSAYTQLLAFELMLSSEHTKHRAFTLFQLVPYRAPRGRNRISVPILQMRKPRLLEEITQSQTLKSVWLSCTDVLRYSNSHFS